MKIKGITFWEQHIERIVLAAAALIAIGFVVMAFLLGNPHAVEVGGVTYEPGTVNELLKDQAERLQGRLGPDAPPAVEVPEPKATAADFSTELASGIAPRETLAQATHVDWPIGGAAGVTAAAAPYVVPTLPKPTMVAARQDFDGLVPTVLDEYPELQDRFTEPPYDLSWNTTFAVVTLKDLHEQILAAGPNGELPIPTKWYTGGGAVNPRLPILALVVEREELIDGEWVDRRIIDAIPGQYSLREFLDGDVDVLARQSVLDAVAEASVQRDIIQPLFYATRNGSWTEPDPYAKEIEVFDDADLTEEEKRIRSLQRRIEKLRKDLANKKQRLEEMGGPVEIPEREPPRRGGDDNSGGSGNAPPGSGGGGGVAGGGGALGDPTDNGPQSEENLAARRTLTLQVRNIERQLTRDLASLQELTGVIDDTVETVDDAGPLDGDEVVVWAHDLDIEANHTYRYRIAVEFFNPFFGRNLSLVDEQEHLAEKISKIGPVSDWSEPKTAQPPLRVFITRAMPADDRPAAANVNAILGSVTAEVYRFFDGRWWMEQGTVYPGQRVGWQNARSNEGVDFRTDWFLLDVVPFVDITTNRLGNTSEGAIALLQSLAGDLMEVRIPASEARSGDRGRLTDDVDQAEYAAGG